jgi:hypothetical protein
MAWITAVQYAGFTVTPIFGALFNFLIKDKEYKFGLFRINMFTAPAYFMAVVVAFTLFILSKYFRHRIPTHKPPTKSKNRKAVDEVSRSTTCIGITVYDCCILGCMLLNISSKGSIASFETLGVSIAESHFQMTSAAAGVIVGFCGFIGVGSLLSMGHLAAYVTDIQLITGGMLVMAAGIASLTVIEEGAENKPWRFMLSMFLIYSIGYPVGHTAVIGLFSKSKYSSVQCASSCVRSYYCQPVSRLTRVCFLVRAHDSCWSTTTRRVVGMVCVSRLLGSDFVSDLVWLHCHVPGCRNALLLAGWSFGCSDCIYSVVSKDVDLSVIVSEETCITLVRQIVQACSQGGQSGIDIAEPGGSSLFIVFEARLHLTQCCITNSKCDDFVIGANLVVGT